MFPVDIDGGRGAASATSGTETVDAALQACREAYGIEDEMWQDVPDPEPGCQHDWITPVRVREGVMERRENGEWVPFAAKR